MTADKVLVVVGRKPNSRNLGLEKTQVKTNDKGFIIVDSQMRTTQSNIFAIGDVVGQPMLAHKAAREAKVAAEVIANIPSAFDNKVIPFVVFNDPELLSVGLTLTDALAKKLDAKESKFPHSALGKAMIHDQTDGFVKIVSDVKTKLIYGIHAVGPTVSELGGEAALAIEMGATLDDLSLTIHPHPTMSESFSEVADVALGSAIHIFKAPEKK
jgi:dihydrolipoamide dehydrogenase